MHHKSGYKDFFYLLTISLLVLFSAYLYYTRRYVPEHAVAVFFNQDRPLNDEIDRTIRDADRFVYFAIYTFTRNDIKDALLAAKYRGVKVVGVTDADQLGQVDVQQKIVKELREAGIPVTEDSHDGIMHLKLVVTEKAYASGSYNWTAAATNINDEVLEVGTDPGIRQQYQQVIESAFRRNGVEE